MIHTIDATNKSLGRTASAVAKILIGKHQTGIVRNKVMGDKVKLINVSKAKINEQKLDTKTYARYSGYPGGLKHDKMSFIVSKKGYGEIFKNAIYGMIPANKLRSEIMKNVTITE